MNCSPSGYRDWLVPSLPVESLAHSRNFIDIIGKIRFTERPDGTEKRKRMTQEFLPE